MVYVLHTHSNAMHDYDAFCYVCGILLYGVLEDSPGFEE